MSVTPGSLPGGGQKRVDGFLEVGARPFVAFRADIEPGQFPLGSMIAVHRLWAISVSPG